MEHPYEINSLGKLERQTILKQALATLAKYAALINNTKYSSTPLVNKTNLINKAIQSSQGKAAMAAPMAAPIRRSLDYQGIARKALLVTPLPQGALPLYDKSSWDFKHDNYQITNRGKLTTKSSATRKIVVPSFTNFQSPSVKIGDVKKRRFNLIDKVVQKARQEIMSQEDDDIFAQLDAVGDGYIRTFDAIPEKKLRKRKKKTSKRRNKLA